MFLGGRNAILEAPAGRFFRLTPWKTAKKIPTNDRFLAIVIVLLSTWKATLGVPGMGMWGVHVSTSGKKIARPFWTAACLAESKNKKKLGKMMGRLEKRISFASKMASV